MYRMMICAVAVLLVAAQPATADDNSTCSSGTGDEAIAACSHLLTLNPNDAHAYYNRANAYFRKGDHDRALADYDQMIRLDPKNVIIMNTKIPPRQQPR